VTLFGEKITKGQWGSLLGAWAGWALDAMDWTMLAMVFPLLKAEFGVSLPQLGMLATATLGGAAIGGIIFGILADYYGRVKMLTFTMIWYGLGTAACGFAQSYEQLLIIRAITGIGIGGEWGIGATLVAEYWPDRLRARAIGLVHSGWSIGYGLSVLCMMFVAPTYGWRVMFFLGIIPAIVAVLIRLGVQEPEVWIKAREERAKGIKADVAKFPLASLFAAGYRRVTILACIFIGGALMANWGLSTWLPTYLKSAKGLDFVKTGIFLIVYQLGVFIGYQAYGWFADKKGRRYAFFFGLTGGGITTVIFSQLSSPQVILWFNFIFGLSMGFYGLTGTFISELYPAHARATGTSFIMNMGRFLSMFSPVIIGAVAQTQGLAFGIATTVGFLVIGIIALCFLPETVRAGVKLYSAEAASNKS
jgi:MFS family permease